MTDLGAFFLSVGIFFFGCAIDNGLTNIAHALKAKSEDKE